MLAERRASIGLLARLISFCCFTESAPAIFLAAELDNTGYHVSRFESTFRMHNGPLAPEPLPLLFQRKVFPYR